MTAIERIEAADFEFSVPLLIVGAGACGLVTALAAKKAGLECLILERDSEPAGSTAMSYGGICGAGTRDQAREGIADVAAALKEDILAITKGQTDPALAHLIAHESGPTVDWLIEELGLDLKIEPLWTGLGHRVPRLHMPPNRSGQELMGMLLTSVRAADIDILTDATVTTLVVDQADTVLGVRFQRPDGAVESIGADAVMLASCGYGANEELIKELMPELDGAVYYGHEGNHGDALMWGKALGAATGDLSSYQALGSLSDPGNIVVPHTLLMGGGAQINLDGERFEDELDDVSGQALTILRQPEGKCWIVYDERLHAEAKDRFAEYADGQQLGIYKTADTVAELAQATKLPKDTLTNTLGQIAAFKAEGVTDQFGRDWKGISQLEPPFYAVRVTGALFHTQGGLCINDQAQVVRADGTAFPNLYAGGGAARSVSGPSAWGYLPGMGLCTAVTLGRVAGLSAAKMVKE